MCVCVGKKFSFFNVIIAKKNFESFVFLGFPWRPMCTCLNHFFSHTLDSLLFCLKIYYYYTPYLSQLISPNPSHKKKKKNPQSLNHVSPTRIQIPTIHCQKRRDKENCKKAVGGSAINVRKFVWCLTVQTDEWVVQNLLG